MKNSEKSPVSIADRLRSQGVSFVANAPIAHALEPGDVDVIERGVAVAAQALLDALLIDPDHNTDGTAKRIAKMLVREVGAGRYTPPPTVTDFPNAEGYKDPYMVGPVTVRSTCSHHFAPIMGRAWIAVEAGDRVIGLSKFNRVSDWIFSRFQIQEEAVCQLADFLEKAMSPDGLAVVVQAQHFCSCWRGVRDNSRMLTTVLRGTFKDGSMDHFGRAAIMGAIQRGLES